MDRSSNRIQVPAYSPCLRSSTWIILNITPAGDSARRWIGGGQMEAAPAIIFLINKIAHLIKIQWNIYHVQLSICA